MTDPDWNDLRYMLEVARAGSAAAAARALGVSHATIVRRIQALEKAFGAPLFDRSPIGYVATEAGDQLLEVGHRIEGAMAELQGRFEGRARELAGTLRFTTTDSLAYTLVPPLLASFRTQHPAIRVDLLVTNHLLDLDRREADVTLRPSAHPPESWFGSQPARMDFAIYGSAAYLAAHADVPWQQLDWLVPTGPLAATPVGQWALAQAGEGRAVSGVDSFIGLHRLAQASLGIVVLPRFLARLPAASKAAPMPDPALPPLRELAVAPPATAMGIWVLTPASLRQARHVRAFMAHLAMGMRANRSEFEIPNRRS